MEIVPLKKYSSAMKKEKWKNFSLEYKINKFSIFFSSDFFHFYSWWELLRNCTIFHFNFGKNQKKYFCAVKMKKFVTNFLKSTLHSLSLPLGKGDGTDSLING